jgi:hypothetical protein
MWMRRRKKDRRKEGRKEGKSEENSVPNRLVYIGFREQYTFTL